MSVFLVLDFDLIQDVLLSLIAKEDTTNDLCRDNRINCVHDLGR
jgi:hypothetical protein